MSREQHKAASVSEAAAELGREVMMTLLPADDAERADQAFAWVHLHGFIDAYEAVREAGLDPHEFVEAMMRETPGERLIEDARGILLKAHEQAAKKKGEMLP